MNKKSNIIIVYLFTIYTFLGCLSKLLVFFCFVRNKRLRSRLISAFLRFKLQGNRDYITCTILLIILMLSVSFSSSEEDHQKKCDSSCANHDVRHAHRGVACLDRRFLVYICEYDASVSSGCFFIYSQYLFVGFRIPGRRSLLPFRRGLRPSGRPSFRRGRRPSSGLKAG